MYTALKIVSALALAAWFGAMLFFSAGVAPVAFGVLPSRELAGSVVNGSMARLFSLAMIAGGLLLASLGVRALWRRSRLAWAKVVLATGMLSLALYSGFAVSPPMAELRATHGAMEKLPAEHPDRVRFNAMHQLSVALMASTMLVGMVLIGLEQVKEREA